MFQGRNTCFRACTAGFVCRMLCQLTRGAQTIGPWLAHRSGYPLSEQTCSDTIGLTHCAGVTKFGTRGHGRTFQRSCMGATRPQAASPAHPLMNERSCSVLKRPSLAWSCACAGTTLCRQFGEWQKRKQRAQRRAADLPTLDLTRRCHSSSSAMNTVPPIVDVVNIVEKTPSPS